MAGLPCTVSAVLVLALLGTVADSTYVCQPDSPVTPIVDWITEKCMNEVETGSDMSNEERQSAADAVNMYRAFIANECDKFKSGKPKSANFRKIRYSCALEKRVKFECPANANDDFSTSGEVFRHIGNGNAGSIFYRIAPKVKDVEINGGSLDFVDNSVRFLQTMRFYLNGDAVEIGCYKKKCHGNDYLACTTGTQVQTSGALYTAGTRCRSHFDCKYSQYRVCDMELGLCQKGNLPYHCGKPDECAYLEIKPEPCSRDVNPINMGSLMSNEERRFVVEAINLMRGLVANQCDFKNGKPKSANLRKVEYNCRLEERAKFDCPADPIEDSDENVLRIHFEDKENGPRTSAFYRKTPVEHLINLDADGKPNRYFYGKSLFAFSVNPAATEVGCFLRLCNGHDTMECVADAPFHEDRPLYTPGNRCQKDADCKEPGYPICDMDYGLCGKVDSKYFCGTPVSPEVSKTAEKCLNEVETGSEMSNEYRQASVDAVNMYRAFITNGCDSFKTGKPPSASLKKIRYSCALEEQVKFDCPANANDEFKTSGKVFRHTDIVYSTSILHRLGPWLYQIGIDGQTRDFVDNSVPLSQNMRFYLNGDATEIGCYLKTCHGKEYVACTTGTDIPTSGPLYTAVGFGCKSNYDCIHSDYRVCDIGFGLCQQGRLPYQCGQTKPVIVEMKSEKCSFDVNTGTDNLMSNAERRFTVEAINLMRGFIANQCDAFKSGKPTSANLRKVHYNCKLEERAKFECPANKRGSDKNVLRIHWHLGIAQPRTSVFYRRTPILDRVNLDADGRPVEDFYGKDLLAFSLNPDTTEVGCFLRLCNGHEYMECVAGVPFHDDSPLYTPGNRCQKDADCTEPGYPICDMEYGLCDKAASTYVCKTPDSPYVKKTPEKCLDKVETGSEMSNENRQAAVDAVNLYRAFITNGCDVFKTGKPPSANLRKIRYSCALEEQVKFDCPANPNDDFKTSGKVFRFTDIVHPTSILHRIGPWLYAIGIDGQTRDFVDNSVRFSQNMRFYLNGDATEIGCYLKTCHGKEYVACTTGTEIPPSGPLYTAGTPCRSNSGCLNPGYQICDTEYGLCERGCQSDADCTATANHVCNRQSGLCGPLTCKFDDASLTVDPCKELLLCRVEPDVTTDPQQHICRAHVIIAERNIDHTFTVKGFGVAVGEKHFLSSVTSEFQKYGNSELYVIKAGYEIIQLRGADVFPKMNIGSYNVNAWQDLTLVQLPAGSTFDSYFDIKKTAPGPQDKLTTLRLKADEMVMRAIQLQSDAECEKIFARDRTLSYVPNSNMACGLDDNNDKGAIVLSGGAPLSIGNSVYGIRSVASLDPDHRDGFLVTKLAPNCDWLSRASDGAVKCV